MPGDQELSSSQVATGPLQYDVYQRSQANITRLKDRLPEDLIASLVREVIKRVSSKDEIVSAYEPSQDDLIKLSEALIADDDDAATLIIARLRSDGTPAETIYLKHLARSARLLGEWWEEDRVTFSRVTIGSGRIFAIMRSMRHLFEPPSLSSDKTAVFASVPGEDHTLGVRMAADMFRKDGWDIDLKVGLDHDELVAEIEKNPRGIVGLSISGVHSLEPLSRLIVALNISCPQSRVFVSGPDVNDMRPTLDLMGLDGIADSIDEAKVLVADIWDKRSSEHRV